MKIWYILFAIAYCNFATAQSKNVKSGEFIQYKNENTISMGMDGVVIKDKYFTLEIPVGFMHSKFIGSTAFMQVLDFKDQSKIILLYIPNADSSTNHFEKGISYKKFVSFCEEEDIIDYLDEGIDFKRTRLFGINRLEKGSFYAIYLNVKRNHLKLYNYSIGSVHF